MYWNVKYYGSKISQILLYEANNIVLNSNIKCIFVFVENVGRLKKLEYLNLALNNVEIIENLEGKSNLELVLLSLSRFEG